MVGHTNPSLANVPIALTDRPGQRALWHRFALEGPFGARRASCGWFGVGHGTGGGEQEPLSLPRTPVRRERVGVRRYGGAKSGASVGLLVASAN